MLVSSCVYKSIVRLNLAGNLLRDLD
jgi:hypothetical protein